MVTTRDIARQTWRPVVTATSCRRRNVSYRTLETTTTTTFGNLPLSILTGCWSRPDAVPNTRLTARKHQGKFWNISGLKTPMISRQSACLVGCLTQSVCFGHKSKTNDTKLFKHGDIPGVHNIRPRPAEAMCVARVTCDSTFGLFDVSGANYCKSCRQMRFSSSKYAKIRLQPGKALDPTVLPQTP